MDEIYKFLTGQYGFLGLSIFVMAGVIIYLFKDSKKERKEMLEMHRKERSEWRGESDKKFETVVKVASESTSAVNAIKTLIESIDKRVK